MTASLGVFDTIAMQVADVETVWSVGTFGAIAEFMRDAGETATCQRADDKISAFTSRGGLRINAHAALRLVASESLTTKSWSHRVALCLPEAMCSMNRRTVLIELGPDKNALRKEDRAALLFDLGLGILQLDACIRVADPDVIAALRPWTGRPLFDPDNGAMGVILMANPHRVFVSHVGRVEVYQPIPSHDGKSPEGPHTHILPKLLLHRRTHAATESIPPGWVPCAHFYPPHPARDLLGHTQPFRHDRHAAFQELLSRFGEPKLVEIKRQVSEYVKAGQDPSVFSQSGNRLSRAVLRVALRQIKMSGQQPPVLERWISAHDQAVAMDAEEDHPCTS